MSEPTIADRPQAPSPSPFTLVGDAAPVCVDGVCALPAARDDDAAPERPVEPGPATS